MLRRRRQNTPVTVAVTPTASTAHPGTRQFTATVTNIHGTAITRPGVWSSSDVTNATISQSGLATTVSTGPTDINFAATLLHRSVSDATPAVFTVT